MLAADIEYVLQMDDRLVEIEGNRQDLEYYVADRRVNARTQENISPHAREAAAENSWKTAKARTIHH